METSRRVSLTELKSFYGNVLEPKHRAGDGRRKNARAARIERHRDRAAIRTARGSRALLFINPHTSFYFRSELQMTSSQGLNAYGASTWGQFFIYQGFQCRYRLDAHLVRRRQCRRICRNRRPARAAICSYRYGHQYATADDGPDHGRVSAKPTAVSANIRLVTFRTHHGPIVAARDGKMIATALMVETGPGPRAELAAHENARPRIPISTSPGLQANSSNDTILADRKGEIAYLHPQFVPIRDNKFDYTPRRGRRRSRDRLEGAAHAGLAAPEAINPDTGWVRNTNDWPWAAAGNATAPRRKRFSPLHGSRPARTGAASMPTNC